MEAVGFSSLFKQDWWLFTAFSEPLLLPLYQECHLRRGQIDGQSSSFLSVNLFFISFII